MLHTNNKLDLLSVALPTAGSLCTFAWAQTAMPTDAAVTASARKPRSVPATHADVKAEAKGAEKGREIPKGEASTPTEPL